MGKLWHCKNKNCIWRFKDKRKDLQEFNSRIIRKFSHGDILLVPREIGAWGHILLIPNHHYKDLTVSIPKSVRNEIIRELNHVCKVIKNNLEYKNTPVERVYVASLNESGDEHSHLHFHIVPRYSCDRTGFEYLYLAELEETKFEKKSPKDRLEFMRTTIDTSLKELKAGRWQYKTRKKKIAQQMVRQMRKILCYAD